MQQSDRGWVPRLLYLSQFGRSAWAQRRLGRGEERIGRSSPHQSQAVRKMDDRPQADFGAGVRRAPRGGDARGVKAVQPGCLSEWRLSTELTGMDPRWS